MSEKVHKSICPECGSYRVTYEHTDDYDWQLCTCKCCGESGTPDEFFYNSVFAKITSSPEVLAEEFVETMYDRVAGDYRYYSMLTGEFYNSREEAIAATVARLKEVEK